MSTLLRTPLHAAHERLGARMVPFAGWSMPVQYAGIVAEHRAVRTAAGLFDVSHMGEIDVAGPGAAACVTRLACLDIGRLAVGAARYSLILDDAGGVIDDVIVYRLGEDRYRIVANAANTGVVAEHARAVAAGLSGVDLRDRSAEFGLIAIQGPRAEAILQCVAAADLAAIGIYRCREMDVAGVPALVARTGYTGEDGFELFAAAGRTEALWTALLEAGASAGLQPAGLGARDTLRLEASFPLYGHELTREVSPLEVGLGRFVSTGDAYVGASAIAAQRTAGVARCLACLKIDGRAIARAGFAITTIGGEPAGMVMSGGYAPWLELSVAMGLVGRAHAAVGGELLVTIRGRPVVATVVERPFYKRRRVN
ncbi:MAG: glycine cleavage system aminomethyltransferase GcvT [Spirochaetaceae bacterium]|nr:glycine cleavage system aminomethyltransferase GcvT [Spirochaetaceae bacterium]